MAERITIRATGRSQAGPEPSEGPGRPIAACRTTHPLPHHPPGLTLIEVVAAIAILGTVLVGITLSQSRHTRQLAAAQQQSAAAQAADQLISEWWTNTAGVPLEEHGEFETDGRRYAWQTRLRDAPELARWGARVVRVTVGPVINQSGGQGGGKSGGAVSQIPADHRLHVDLVLADPEWEPHSTRRNAAQEQNAEGLGTTRSKRGQSIDETGRPDKTDSPDDRTRRGTQGGGRDESDTGEGERRPPGESRKYPGDQSDRWFERREKQ